MAKSDASSAVACPTCGKVINRQSDLPRHMQLHAPDAKRLKHACPYVGCEYSAFQKSNLKTHLNTHTGERPHKCPTQGCEFSSADPGSLNRHRRNMHGHQANGKPKSGSHAPARTPKTNRQQRKFAPYQSSSSSSSTPPTPMSNASHSAQIPSPCIPECDPSSLLLATEKYVEGTKHASVAYETALIYKHPQVQVNDAESSFAENTPPLTLDSRVPTDSDVPLGELPQLLMPEQEELYGVDSTPQLVFGVANNGELFDSLYSRFNNWLPDVGPVYGDPSYSTPMVKHDVDSAQLPTLPSLSPETYEDQYSVRQAFLSTPRAWILPAYEAQYPSSGAPSHTYEGCATQATPFANFLEFDAFATPDIWMGVYPLANQDYFYGVNNYYVASTSGTFTMQGSYS